MSDLDRYVGSLNEAETASAMQAARLNASDLLDTAKILFDLKRFGHSMAYSILAIEESGKVAIILAIFLGLGESRQALWKEYVLHRAKTKRLNLGIEARIRAEFPEIDPSEAKRLGEMGPSPDALEEHKQRAIYSDCVSINGKFVCHLPRGVEWRELSWHRLCEAVALVTGLRDYSSRELALWRHHAQQAKAKGHSFASVLRPLSQALVDGGFIKSGAWDTLLSDTEGLITESD